MYKKFKFSNQINLRVDENKKYIERLKERWISKLLDIEFKGKDIILRQLANATVEYTCEYAYISIKFILADNVELFPYNVRVPVEMTAYQKSSAPILFLIHVVNGVISELEILTADSSRIDIDNIDLESVEYDINSCLQE